MSGPYDQYGGQYQQQSQYPAGGYSQQPQYPQQGYNQQPQYGGYQDQSFGPPRRADSFGPPQAGGFQHGQQGMAYGQYDASNPQGHSSYYGAPQQQPHEAYAQNQQYQAQMAQGGAQTAWNEQNQQQHQFSRQSSDPKGPNYDPSAPPMNETDRGLLGAIGGGIAGGWGGHKVNHGFLGTIGGAILGSLTEDYAKDKKKHHKHSGSSSWGGSRH